MKALFFPCTLDGLSKHTGSKMIRCEWVCDYWDEAELYDGTQRLKDFQLFVFQKAYLSRESQRLIGQLARLRDSGKDIRLSFDLCDPDFLSTVHRERLLNILPLMDFVTAPTQLLGEWLGQYAPFYLIPDGVNLSAIPVYRGFVDNRPPKIVWMGYQGNMGALDEMAQAMNDLGVTGEIVSITSSIPFEKFVAQMVEHDVLLNPRPNRSPYMYKSDNKTLVAWAAGVAVARDGAELEELLDPEKRAAHIEAGINYVSVDGPGNIAETVDSWIRACIAEGIC